MDPLGVGVNFLSQAILAQVGALPAAGDRTVRYCLFVMVSTGLYHFGFQELHFGFDAQLLGLCVSH